MEAKEKMLELTPYRLGKRYPVGKGGRGNRETYTRKGKRKVRKLCGKRNTNHER